MSFWEWNHEVTMWNRGVAAVKFQCFHFVNEFSKHQVILAIQLLQAVAPSSALQAVHYGFYAIFTWGGRNEDWDHLYNLDVISMPVRCQSWWNELIKTDELIIQISRKIISAEDKWEYPWYATWALATDFVFAEKLHHEIFWDDKIDKLWWSPQDLAFHCLPLALVDAGFAKDRFFSRKHITASCAKLSYPQNPLELFKTLTRMIAITCLCRPSPFHLFSSHWAIRPYSGYWQATGMDHSTRFSGTAASTDFREAMAKPDVTSFNQIRSVCSGTQIIDLVAAVCFLDTKCIVVQLWMTGSCTPMGSCLPMNGISMMWIHQCMPGCQDIVNTSISSIPKRLLGGETHWGLGSLASFPNGPQESWWCWRPVHAPHGKTASQNTCVCTCWFLWFLGLRLLGRAFP